MGDGLRRSKSTDIRRGLYELLEQGPIGERRTRFVSRLIILMIIVNLVAASARNPSPRSRPNMAACSR